MFTVLLTLYCCRSTIPLPLVFLILSGEMGAMLGITGFLYRGNPNRQSRLDLLELTLNRT